MKILISGSTGLVGSHLLPYFEKQGHTVIRLTRKGPGIIWDPEAGTISTPAMEGFDAVIHLAGESIAKGRWNDAKKKRIRESRVRGTQILCQALAQLKAPPKTLICASAIGYYGSRDAETLTESSAPGHDFLAEVCQAWEASTRSALQRGIRVVNLRFGVILSAKGGALGTMLTPFKLGMGGKIGTGQQYMSWITLDDVLGVVQYALENESLRGPVNTVAPQPVTNEQFTQTLGQVLSRPTLFPMPAFAARLAFGEMADALLLSSQKVEPALLHQGGFAFRYPNLEGALKHLLSHEV